MNSSFPMGYSPPAIESKFDEKFLSSLEKDPPQLHTFFQFAINDVRFWNSQSKGIKQKIFKLIEKNIFQKDDQGKRMIIETISSLYREKLGQALEDLNDSKVLLPYLVGMANTRGAEDLKKKCLETFNEEIGTKEVEINNNGLIITVDDFKKIDSDALEKCITFLKVNYEIEIKLLVNKDQSIKEFLDRFKTYICEIYFNSQTLFELPVEIGELENLKSLKVLRSIYLERLPQEITNLKNLKELSLSGCSRLNSLPNGMANLKNLEVLNLSNSVELISLPEELGQLVNLKQLILRNCYELKFIPNSLEDLTDLETLNLVGCNQLQSICSFEKFINLKELALPYCWSQLSRLKIFLDLEKENLNVNSLVSAIFNSKEEYQSKVKINDLNVLKELLKGYFKSTNKEMIEKCVILTPQVKDFLLTEEGKEILIEFHEQIFMNKYSIMNFMLENYSTKLVENWDLYPIKFGLNMGDHASSINIKCIQEQVLSRDYLEVFLNIISTKIKESDGERRLCYDLYIQYYGQLGIDDGALRRDFVVNLFKTLSDFWELDKGIPETEQEKFRLLGPILKLVFLNRGKTRYNLGNVFSQDYFKGMMAFTEDQLFSDFNKLSVKNILDISLSFKSEEKRKLVEDISNFLFWDGSAKEINGKIESLLSLSEVEEELSLEVLKMLETDCPDSKNVGDVEIEDAENLPLNNVLAKRKVLANNENSPKCKKRKIEVDEKQKIEALQNYILKNKNVDFLKSIITKTLFEDVKNQVHNLHHILNSWNYYEDDWGSPEFGFEQFMISIQGLPFTREKFLSSLEYINIRDEIRKDFEDWIKEADEVKVKEFLSLITGSDYLSKNAKIKIEGNSKNFEVNCCFFTVKIPNNINRDVLWPLLDASGENSFNKH